MRVCFYVNKRFSPDRWDVTYTSDDICILRIHTDGQHNKELVIYNVYNPSLISYISIDSPSLLLALRQLLEGVTQHTIVLGDFNVHYYVWADNATFTRHTAADQLVEMTSERNMGLMIEKGTKTWELRGTWSTIDLSFATPEITEIIQYCGISPELMQTSDHIPITIQLRL